MLDKNKLVSLSTKNKIKGLIRQGECCLIELLQWTIDNSDNKYPIVTQAEVSVNQLLQSHLGDLNNVISKQELRRFAFSCARLDAVIFLKTDNFYPLLAVERQSPYHDDPKRQENDLMKIELMKMIDLPLLWQDEPRKGILRFLQPPSHELCTVNPFNNQGRSEFENLILSIVQSRLQLLDLSQVA